MVTVCYDAGSAAINNIASNSSDLHMITSPRHAQPQVDRAAPQTPASWPFCGPQHTASSLRFEMVASGPATATSLQPAGRRRENEVPSSLKGRTGSCTHHLQSHATGQNLVTSVPLVARKQGNVIFCWVARDSPALEAGHQAL